MIFKIFDKIKVKVDTTTEFPLDIKCSLVIDKDDHEEFNKLAMEQEAAIIMAEGAKRGQEAPRILGILTFLKYAVSHAVTHSHSHGPHNRDLFF